MSFVLTCSTHGLTHEAKIGIESSVAEKIRTGTISQRNQLESTGIQQFLYSRAVGKDEVASSNLASSSKAESLVPQWLQGFFLLLFRSSKIRLISKSVYQSVYLALFPCI